MPETTAAPHLLVSTMGSGQNIGDVGHTLSMVRVLQRWAPQTSITLWPLRPFSDAERAMLQRHAPEVAIVDGGLDADGRPDTPGLERVFDAADIFVHGSGPSVHRRAHMAAWATATGKPYGVFGVTVDPLAPSGGTRSAAGDPLPDGGPLDLLAAEIGQLPPDHLGADLRRLLDGASFVYCRDTLSAGYLQSQGVASPVVGFGPDATFAFDTHNDLAAAATLGRLGLADAPFVCVVPRLRYSPRPGDPPSDEGRRRESVNAATLDADLGLLRDAVVGVVRQTGVAVLVCPEMSYQVALAAEYVTDRLPADVAAKVVRLPRFWLPDEAAAVYARTSAIVSMECHSPIMATVADTPGLYIRQPTDTVKGHMWRDLGLGAHLCEIAETGPDEVIDWVASATGRDVAEVRARSGAAVRRSEAALEAMVGSVVAAASGTGAVGRRG